MTFKIKLPPALLQELQVTEVENFSDKDLTGAQKEMSEAIDNSRGTVTLSREATQMLADACDNIHDISMNGGGGYYALGRSAGKKRDEIDRMLAETKSNPGSMPAFVGLGRLVSLEVLNPHSGRVALRKGGAKWLAWEPAHKRFVMCTMRGRGATALPGKIAKAHRRFHNAASRSAVTVEFAAPVGALTQVGLVKALTYRVPKTVKSPEKNRYLWHHAFGDTGHAGGDNYPERVMPALMRDAKGNLFIQRRPGNIFTVDTWLRG